MSSYLTIEEALSTWDRLATAVADCAAREKALNRVLTVGVTAAAAEFEEAVAEEAAALEAAVAAQESANALAKQSLATHYERRERRIRAAFEKSRQDLHVWFQGREGRRRNKIQIAFMEAGRVHNARLQEADRAFAEMGETLAAADKELVVLKRQAYLRFLGYTGCLKPPCDAKQGPGGDEIALMASFREAVEAAEAGLSQFGSLALPRFSRLLPLWITLPPLLFGLTSALLAGSGLIASAHFSTGGWWIVAICAPLCALYLLGRRQALPVGREVGEGLDTARDLLKRCGEQSAARHKQELADAHQAYEDAEVRLQNEWDAVLAEDVSGLQKERERNVESKGTRLLQWLPRLREARNKNLDDALEETVTKLRKESEARTEVFRQRNDARRARLKSENELGWRELVADWQRTVYPLYQRVEEASQAASALFPDWGNAGWHSWTPPKQFAEVVEFARLKCDLGVLCDVLPQDERLALPQSAQFSIPACMTFPEQGSILFESRTACSEGGIGALNNIILRLMSVSPPGKVSFTILDPVELGQNFAGVMHLADYEESLVNSRIWTQPRQIEERLADLTEHMEKVIQMYLRNDYATIADYNHQAGEIAEKYHFLVIADFPANFSELAVRRLLSITASGARCGVHTLIHWDQRRPLPQDCVPSELRKNMICLNGKGDNFVFTGKPVKGANLFLGAPPEADDATEFLKKVGRASIDSNRVQVPFAHVSPVPARLWSMSATDEVRVAIGRTGATKLQYLALGKGTRQHVLIAGKTGSGKSTLFHVLITNLALWYSPDEVEFYLVDFKKGVEFKCYASGRLPHARVIAIESDREFGLSVLQRIDDELRHRGDLFRELGAQDLAAYRKAGGAKRLPRTLLIVDEFQEFFVEDDRTSQAAAMLLDRIVRQGRAFGIHVLLGSQTLGGAYTLARATLGQMAVRVALQCNEADAYLIMDDDNAAPRLLSRPGEAIYNDAAGRMEGNSPFQVVWLTDEERAHALERVRGLAERETGARSGLVVFEGNAPADVVANTELWKRLEAEAVQMDTSPRVWLGEPNRIKGPTEAVFLPQSGNNLLCVGQRDESMLATVVVALVSLAAQCPSGRLRLVVLDGSPPDSAPRELLESVVGAMPHLATLVGPRDLPVIISDLASEMAKRNTDEHGGNAPVTFLLIHGLQKYKKLRYEEDFGFDAGDTGPSAGAQLNDLICEGSAVGMHVIVTTDTYSNVSRFLSRKALGEFEMRVMYQMSAGDSASLTDSADASQLGLHRALFYNEQEGYSEIFRPYALPDNAWLKTATDNLRRLHS